MKDLNDFLAVEVMGWHNWLDSADTAQVCLYDWNPTENIEHAMMCLSNFRDWELTRDSMLGYSCCISEIPDGVLHYGKADAPAPAIATACARAKGWEDKGLKSG